MKEEKDFDMVNSPFHYTQGKYEAIDIIEWATKDMCGIEAICVSNILKYILRYKYKGGLVDVMKAQWYLDRLIATLKEDE